MTLSASWVSSATAPVLGYVSVRYAPPLPSPSLRITSGPRKRSRREAKKPGNGKGGETNEGVSGNSKDTVKKEVAAVEGFGGRIKARSRRGVGNSGAFGRLGEEPETWSCVSGCGACCKLRKGPSFPSYTEIFSDIDPQLSEMVESMTGDDGWCTNYDHSTRTCSIYAERPFFCRVEPEVFFKLYGIDHKSFNSEACRACKDTIKTVYGLHSRELKIFKAAISSRDLVNASSSTL